MNPFAALAIAFALAFMAESGTEYIFGTPMEKIEKLKPFKWLLMYVGLAAGVGMSWYYQIDVIALIQAFAGGGGAAPEPPLQAVVEATPLGVVLTGLVVGRGANFLHQFVSQYLPVK